MSGKQPKDTMSAVLVRAMETSELSFLALEQATGLKRQSLMKFARGEQSLRLDMADKLAEFFGLVLKEDSRRPAKGTKPARPAARTRDMRQLAELARKGLKAVDGNEIAKVRAILNKIVLLGDV